MRPVAIIQARMQSTRLPGKVLADLAGRPMLGQVIERVRGATLLASTAVATSTAAADDAIADYCQANGVPIHRGSEADVLDRYHGAAVAFRADPIVRITADCPLLDPSVIDRVVENYLRGDAAYVSNVDPPTFPDGQDVEAISFAALERAWREARLPSDREHVTPYVRGHPDLFPARNVRNEEDLSSMRWTVDEPGDLAFVRAVVERLGPAASLAQVADLVRREPSLGRVNAGFRRNEGYERSLRRDPGPP